MLKTASGDSAEFQGIYLLDCFVLLFFPDLEDRLDEQSLRTLSPEPD